MRTTLVALVLLSSVASADSTVVLSTGRHIRPFDLVSIDTAADSECLTYDSASGNFEWAACGGGSGTWDGGAFTDPAEGPDGCANPAYGFGATDTDAGLCLDAANDVRVGVSTTNYLQITENQFTHVRSGATVLSSAAGGLTVGSTAGTADWFVLTPQTGGAAGRYGEFTTADVTANRTWTFPDVSGVPQVNLAAGTAAPGGTECDAANEVGRLYHQTGDPATVNLQLFRCTQTGPASYAWHPAGHYAGTTCPATCTAAAGPICYDTDDDLLKSCTADNTWTTVSGGIADPGANGILVRTALNTTAARTPTVGEGLTGSNLDGVSGAPNHAVDRAVVIFKGAGTADPPATCGDTGDSFQISDNYIETDTKEMYTCDAIDHWTLFGHVTDDKVIVGDGTNAVLETIPDCDDSGGNHLNYNTTGTGGSRFSCGTTGDGAGGAFDPTTTIELIEEFATGPSPGSGYAGALETTGYAINSGTVSFSGATDTLAHMGNLTLNSHASNDNSGQNWVIQGNDFHYIGGWSSGNWEIRYILAPQSVTDTAIYAGLLGAHNTDPNGQSAGIWIRRDTDETDTAFVFQICNASGAAGCGATGDDTNSKTVTSTITPTATNYYLLTITMDQTGVGGNPTIYMSVNGETPKTFCLSGCDDTLGTLSTGSLFPAISWLTRTTSGVQSAYLDLMHLKITGLTRY